MTWATGSNSNIQSVAGPFFEHLIQLGQLQVNPEPNLTRPMDNPRFGVYWRVEPYMRKFNILCTCGAGDYTNLGE